jgi:transcriptional regulator of acetoin/glycerol metabolism/DNA-binding CsgD family transcriptional regulator
VNEPGPASAVDSLRHVLARVEDSPDRGQTISGAIRLSWQRSAEAGLVPDEIRAPYDPDIDADSRLRWAAAPAMAAVSADLPDLPYALLLTDRRCHVIERWTRTARTGLLMDAIGAAAGFVCDEATVGTNSIGLATYTGAPAAVRGYEHYADALTHVSCASAPVIDPRTSQLLGLINFTSADQSYSPVMPALIARIVHETEQRLLAETGVQSTALHDSFSRARRDAVGAVAAVDATTMFVNAAGGTIASDADRARIWEQAQRVLRPGYLRSPQPLELASGAQTASFEPVYEGASLVGVIVRFSGDDGGTPIAMGTDYPWLLTPAERKVAEHVAAGLTNRETAAELFISPHTVDYHLRQIYRKLDIQSRVDLARIVSRSTGAGSSHPA